MAANGLTSLRLEDYSDRELLLIVRDLETDGYVTAEDVAKTIGIKAENPKRSVISRFSWMTRYGAMRREIQTDDTGAALVTKSGRPKYGQRWGLTERGLAVALGNLTAAQSQSIARISEDALVLAVREIARRGMDSGDDTIETLVKREWRYTTSPLRNLNGRR